MRQILQTSFAAGALAMAASLASAITFTEMGDAGGTIATAQAVTDGATTISGSTQTPQDDDMFALTFATGGPFELEIFGITPFHFSPFDIDLFDSTGTLLDSCGNCFTVFGDMPNTVLSAEVDPGTYYVFLDNDTNDGGFGYAGAYSFQVQTTAITPIPLPAGGLLLLTGLGAFVALRRRKVAG